MRVANRGPIAVLRASQHDGCRPRPPYISANFIVATGQLPSWLPIEIRTVEFIEPKPIHRSSHSVSQNHGFANKLGLSPFDSTRIVQALALGVGMVDGWLAD